MAGQKEQQWNLNKFLPWQTEMNRYGEMQKGGMENLFGALQSGAGNITDLVGTKYYTDALSGIDPSADRKEKREERQWLKRNS